MSLGKIIKELRQDKNCSQDELAYHAQIDGRQISCYENDKVTPSVEVVIKLATAIDVSIDHLLFLRTRRNGHSMNRQANWQKSLWALTIYPTKMNRVFCTC